MQDGLSELLKHVGSLTRFERLYTLQKPTRNMIGNDPINRTNYLNIENNEQTNNCSCCINTLF